MTWKKAQAWEENWWGNCVNTFNEEKKQLIYAQRMGLKTSPNPKTPYRFDLKGKSILDIGSGPCSLLLKCENFKQSYAIDPLMNKYPEWVRERYNSIGLVCNDEKGEDVDDYPKVDEVWIYNVLEHVDSPKKVIENAKKVGKIIRLFEWINTKKNPGHPHSLKEKKLDKWLGGTGKTEDMSSNGLFGTAYYGIF